MNSLNISAFSTLSAIGSQLAEAVNALRTGVSGLRRCDMDRVDLDTWVGQVEGVEDQAITGELERYDCRNHRLSEMCLASNEFTDVVERARSRYGSHRIATIIGTSTSGIQETEIAYRHRDPDSGALPQDYRFSYTHSLYSTAEYVALRLGLAGPVHTVSTACSTSLKVFADAYRYMQSGIVDAVVVGGVDSLCMTTLYGFNSLELVSSKPCAPFSADRDGISVGEAAGFALLEWPNHAENSTGVAILGYGESSDAWHMSSPRPDGSGAAEAMRAALQRADLSPEDIDYINLHGTATKANDAMEDKAVISVFGDRTPASSTKGWTGHTLGAAGITETIFSALCIQHGFMPQNLNLGRADPELRSRVLAENSSESPDKVLTSSFGFGGSNAALILGKTL